MPDRDRAIPSGLDPKVALSLPRATSFPFDPNAALGEYANVLDRAATGDLQALREIRDQAAAEALQAGTSHPHAFVLAAEALTPARLCASQRQPEDVRMLASMLCFVSDALRHNGVHDSADIITGEAVVIMEGLAAAGDEYCAIASDQLVTAYPRASIIARSLSEMDK